MSGFPPTMSSRKDSVQSWFSHLSLRSRCRLERVTIRKPAARLSLSRPTARLSGPVPGCSRRSFTKIGGLTRAIPRRLSASRTSIIRAVWRFCIFKRPSYGKRRSSTPRFLRTRAPPKTIPAWVIRRPFRRRQKNKRSRVGRVYLFVLPVSGGIFI